MPSSQTRPLCRGGLFRVAQTALCGRLHWPDDEVAVAGAHRFDDMRAAYVEQISALIDAGVDVLLIETCQDLLQAKIATIAAFDVMRKKGSGFRCRCK